MDFNARTVSKHFYIKIKDFPSAVSIMKAMLKARPVSDKVGQNGTGVGLFKVTLAFSSSFLFSVSLPSI